MTQIDSLSSQSKQPDFVINAEAKTSPGILIAGLILGLWVISITLFFLINIYQTPIPLIAIALLWQTFLYTGLFITAHDAMHGVVFPQNPKINNWIGRICVFLYALFSYQELLQKHWSHHRYPATKDDPDFYDHQQQNFFAWYFNFIKSYWNWRQHLRFILVYIFLRYICNIHEANLILFWCIPSILSSIQLFYFGTFLPHRRLAEGYTSSHCTRSTHLPVFWSFITCYHFGYHKEHHEYPHVPWWRLPEVYQDGKQQ
ncbi:fatty acid desaturase [Nostoc sp. FACHB-87]|uniref:beta-carotene ketolase CrtW n=1 Tax=Nostocaceae TaxID=1162 RepID=UPI0016850C67|nr:MULTISPECIES: fatty acid desaturase [Nostocaceae]MBD2456422.1 fatty acid desaturase [Nostoc sp. FACHB-87]MBD2474036.1 fatty acid desaturase [Anabaena sp. FACHB-83]